MVQLVGGGAAGFFGSRFIPENLPMLSQYNVGFVGYGMNALAGLAIAWGLGKVWGRSARTGALVGTGVAVLSRIVVEKFSSSPAASVSGLGDLSFNLGYYTSDHFPFPQGASGGPYQQFPGQPYGQTAMVPTAATAVRAGATAATAALPAAAMPAAGGGGGRWGSNWD